MVRGREDCEQFCQTCRKDCRCSCGCCHTCILAVKDDSDHRIKHFRKKLVLKYHQYTHIHDCASGILVAGHIETKTRTQICNNISSYIGSEMYKVSVGSGEEDEKQMFYVHKAALMKNSEYFKGLLSFNSMSERDQVTLDDLADRPRAFSCFAQFAYGQMYEVSKDHDELLQHAEVYVLSERLGALKLRLIALKMATAVCIDLGSLHGRSGIVDYMSSPAQKAKLQEEAAKLAIIPDVIRVIYEATPSSYVLSQGRPPSLSPASTRKEVVDLTSDDEKHDETPTTSILGKRKDREEQEDEVVQPEPAASRTQDPFRKLLSKFCATRLNTLNTLQTFSDCVAEVPEFSEDLVKNLTQVGRLEVDAEGVLK